LYWLIRALLIQYSPTHGAYWFQGQKVESTNYRHVLECRRQIGFLSSDAALISNQTLRENILLQQQYFNNDLSLVLDNQTTELCALFNLKQNLDLRPARLSAKQTFHGIFVREILKSPKILILAYPEDTIGKRNWENCLLAIKPLMQKHLTVLLVSNRQDWANDLKCRHLDLNGGSFASDAPRT
jgi:ABC-type lipoprotein export system ATPase subunit